jgi:hypothetical protein
VELRRTSHLGDDRVGMRVPVRDDLAWSNCARLFSADATFG